MPPGTKNDLNSGWGKRDCCSCSGNVDSCLASFWWACSGPNMENPASRSPVITSQDRQGSTPATAPAKDRGDTVRGREKTAAVAPDVVPVDRRPLRHGSFSGQDGRRTADAFACSRARASAGWCGSAERNGPAAKAAAEHGPAGSKDMPQGKRPQRRPLHCACPWDGDGNATPGKSLNR
jgi:hypothetical protein